MVFRAFLHSSICISNETVRNKGIVMAKEKKHTHDEHKEHKHHGKEEHEKHKHHGKEEHKKHAHHEKEHKKNN